MRKIEYAWEWMAGEDKDYVLKMPYKLRAGLAWACVGLVAVLLFGMIGGV